MAALDDALLALAGPLLTSVEARQSELVARRGLYAVHGEHQAWQQLGLGEPPDERPLYIGKAEDSFQARDLKQHFGQGNTGRSSLRRSLAALLSAELELVPKPRGVHPLDKTTRAHMFGLEIESDRRLTEWMQSTLCLAFWPCAEVGTIRRLEREAIARLMPPLCIDGKWKPNSWQRQPIEPARRAMTARVRGMS